MKKFILYILGFLVSLSITILGVAGVDVQYNSANYSNDAQALPIYTDNITGLVTTSAVDADDDANTPITSGVTVFNEYGTLGLGAGVASSGLQNHGIHYSQTLSSIIDRESVVALQTLTVDFDGETVHNSAGVPLVRIWVKNNTRDGFYMTVRSQNGVMKPFQLNSDNQIVYNADAVKDGEEELGYALKTSFTGDGPLLLKDSIPATITADKIKDSAVANSEIFLMFNGTPFDTSADGAVLSSLNDGAQLQDKATNIELNINLLMADSTGAFRMAGNYYDALIFTYADL